MSKSVWGVHRPVPAVAVLAALGLLVGACGGDDASAGGAASVGTQSESGALTVVAEDIDFGHDEYRVDAGEIEVVYENEGSIVHTLLIRDVDGFELTVRSGGDVDQGSVELDRGEYELYCDVPGHEAAGMKAKLVAS